MYRILIASSIDTPRWTRVYHHKRTAAIDGEQDEHAQAIFNFKYRSQGGLLTFCVKYHTNQFTLAMLRAIGVLPNLTVGQLNIAPVAIPLRQSRARTEVPSANQETSTVPAAATAATGDLGGLTEEEIIALITHHRGHSRGLHGQARARLIVLLDHYGVSSMYLLRNMC